MSRDLYQGTPYRRADLGEYESGFSRRGPTGFRREMSYLDFKSKPQRL
jgi:hypothetical protein